MTHTQKDALSLSALARISCENARFCAQYTRLSDIVSAVLIAADHFCVGHVTLMNV